MSFESLMARLQRLAVSVETLAAIGAELRLRRERLEGDPRVRALLRDVVHATDPSLLDDLDANRQAPALAFVETMFRQAIDLLENPARSPGWSYQDPAILQSQGEASRLIVCGIEGIAALRPDLRTTLLQPGVFLDVGAGVGALAIEAARAWPALRVVGIDPWEPALALARRNLIGSGVADRVEFRSQRVEHLDETATFALAWLPGPFIAAEIADRALERVHRALTTGGWLIFGFFSPSSNPADEALARLRVVRSGGHPWTAEEVKERLRARKFEEIEAFSPGGPVLLVVGRRSG